MPNNRITFRKITLTILLLFVFQNIKAQITTLDANFQSDIEKLQEKTEVVIPYDSTYNFFKYRPEIYKSTGNRNYEENDPIAYIGQKIFIPKDAVEAYKMDKQFVYKPSGYYTIINIEPESKEKYIYITKYQDSIKGRSRPDLKFNKRDLLGYENFIKFRLKIYDKQNEYYKKFGKDADVMIRKPDGTLVYKDSLGKHYKDLFNKVKELPATYSFMELLSEKGDTLYTRFAYSNAIPVGYFEKTKQLFENKDFYSIGGETTDFYTKEEIRLTRTTYEDFKKGITEPYKVTGISLYGNEIVATMEGKDVKFLTPIGNRINIWDKSDDYSFYYSKWGRNSTFDRFTLVSDYKFKANLEKNRDAKKEQDIINAQEAIKKKEQLRVAKLIEKHGKEKGTIIASGKVSLGMTKEMCKDAWGTPFRTVTRQNNSGVNEVWIYGINTKLYFKNNSLVEILNSK